MLKIMEEEDSWTGGENEEYTRIEAAPKRMRTASRGEMARKRARKAARMAKWYGMER